MTKRPIDNPPVGLRQRQRADGSWRIWWEPTGESRRMGFEVVELKADRLTWSVRRVGQINGEVARARDGALVKPQGRTVADLITAYLKSPRFLKLKPATHRDYKGAFKVIKAKWGSDLVVNVTKSIVNTWYETLYHASGEYQASSLLRKLSVLMSYAETMEWIDITPCHRMKLETPAGRDRVATWAEQDHLVATADSLQLYSIGNAIMLSALNGQRETDCIRLPKSQIDTGMLIFKQSKRGKLVAMRINAELLARLKQYPSPPDTDFVLIYENTGQPYKDLEQFGKAYARVRTLAAKTMPSLARDPVLQFRDLRRTFSLRASTGGADLKQIGNAMGNTVATDPRLAGTYIPPTFDSASAAVDAASRPRKKDRRNA